MLDSKDLEQIAKLVDANTQRIKTEIFTYMEANVGRRLDMLAEGHQALLDTLAPKERPLSALLHKKSKTSKVPN